MRLPANLWSLSVPAIYASGILWIPGLPNIAGLRGLIAYVSVFVIAAATYLWARYFSVKLFTFAIYTWLAVGIIQLFFYRDFASWVLPRFSPDYNFYRGVASLASEPAQYAGMCFFLLLLNELFYSYSLYTKKRYLSLAIILSLQIIMSFSALGLAYLVAFLFLKHGILFLTRLSPTAFLRVFLVLLLLGATAALALNSKRVRSTRAGSILRIAIENPSLLQRDKSIGQRSEKVILPVVAFFRSYGTGLGLGSWSANAGALRSGGNNLIRFPTPYGARISSGWGSSIFELGIFGLALIILVSWVLIRAILRDRSRRAVYLLILMLTHMALINATPIAFPPFSLLIGLCAAFALKPPHQWPGSDAIQRVRTQHV